MVDIVPGSTRDVLVDSLVEPPVERPFAKGLGAGVSGVKSSLFGAGALAAHAVGATGVEEAALARAKAEAEAAAAQSQTLEQVDWTSPSSVANHIKYLLGNALPSLGLMAAGGVVGGGLGALAGRGTAAALAARAARTAAPATRAGAFMGAVAPDVALEAGSIYPEALETGVENPAFRAAMGGTGAAAFDFIPLLAAEKYLKAAGRGGFGALAKGALKGAPVGAALEGSQEVLQAVIERAAAGRPLTDEAAISDYWNSLAGGAVPGALIGAGIGAHRGAAAPVSRSAPVQDQPAFTNNGQAPIVNTPAAQHAAATQQMTDIAAQIASAKATQTTATERLAALAEELKLPYDQRRAKSEILVEQKALREQAKQAKDSVAPLEEQWHASRKAVEALAPQVVPASAPAAPSPFISALREGGLRAGPLELAPEPAVAPAAPAAPSFVESNPLTPFGGQVEVTPAPAAVPVVSDVIADPRTGKTATEAEAERVATSRAVAGVGALLSERGMLHEATTAQIEATTGVRTPREVAVERSRARLSGKQVRFPDMKTRQGATEAAIVAAVQPNIALLVGAKLAARKGMTEGAKLKVAKRDIRVLTDALNSVAVDAAALPTPEAAQAYIAAEVPKALKGRVAAGDAEEVARLMGAAAGNVQFSKAGAVDISEIWPGLRRIPNGAKVDTKYGRGAVVGSKFIQTKDPELYRAYYEQARDEEYAKLGGEHLSPFADAQAMMKATKIAQEKAAEKFASAPAGKGWFIPQVQLENGKVRSVDPTDLRQVYLGPKPSAESNAAITQEEFDALPPDAQHAAVDAFNEVMRERGTALREGLTKIIGVDPNLTVTFFQATPGAPVGGYTRTGPLKSVIALALNAADGMSLAAHEGFHYAEDRLLTSAERQIVKNATKPGRPVFEKLMEKVRGYDIAHQTNLADEVAAAPAEARAYAFEFWRRGELAAEGPLARVFTKLRQFVERVANLVRGLGFQSWEDVFSALDHGQFAERQRGIGVTDNGQLSVSDAARWYKSALTDAVTAMPTKQASAQGWKDQIKGLVGKNNVRQVEIDAVGLNEWLDLQSGRVTKDQVMAFLGENGVRVEEVTLGVPSPNETAYLDSLDEKLRAGIVLTAQERADYDRLGDAETFTKTGEAATKFSQWQLPGGTNYRELLLTLPRVLNSDEVLIPSSRRTIFQSAHFDQPNILAHIRFNERTDVEGKRVLFIEEIQSDWAQKGKKEGFSQKKFSLDDFSAEHISQSGHEKVWRVTNKVTGQTVGSFMGTEQDAIRKALERHEKEQLGLSARQGVPTAPFVTKTEAWVALSLKRMIRYAAENGFDKVAWTNGEQQVERYREALRQVVDRIEWAKTPGGVHIVGYKGSERDRFTARENELLLRQDVAELTIENQEELIRLRKERLASRRKVVDTTEKESAVSDAVGKVMADQIKNDPNQTGVIEGDDITVSDTGMAAFYDKIVPNVANDVLKKLGGGRVQLIRVGGGRFGVGDHKGPNGWFYEDEGGGGDGGFATRAEAESAAADANRHESQENNIGVQPGFTITPELARHAANGLPLFSRAAIDMARREEGGELERHQMFREVMQFQDDARIAQTTPGLARKAYGGAVDEFGGSIKRWWLTNIATPNFIARLSRGFKNVMRVLNTYLTYRETLIERMLREKIPGWYKASFADQDAAFAALLKRTVGGFARGSIEYRELHQSLLPAQQKLFDDATAMVEGLLRAEFATDEVDYKRLLTSEGSYDEWHASRKAQVEEMIAKGYVPLRRYGDHVVTVYKDIVGKDGRTQRLEVAKEMFTHEAHAVAAAKIYTDEVTRQGAPYAVEIGYRHKTVRDTTISVQQFLDTARRNGVAISAEERERLVKALTASEAQVRNRMLRREGMPGYSKDGLRVLNEFGVNMAGKIAYSRFGVAIDAAADGRAVDADVVNGEPVIKIDELRGEPGAQESAEDYESRNIWELPEEKSKAGFYRNLADELSDYVLVPDNTGGWSRKLRGAAMAYFIGGSISGAMVNTMSVPMLLVPKLSEVTPYANAATTTLSSWVTTWRYQHILRDVAKLRDEVNFPIPGIDHDLRGALIAASDKLHDTEIHQIMSISQGSFFSQSRSVQKAMEVWMAPFRISEQTNRITSFIAAYKIGADKNFEGVKRPDGTRVKGALSGQALFSFAREMVDATQNNYSEANRPGAARSPIFAMMFMFKSFPLFMTEAAVLMYKASPKAAVFMLLGLVAMTGVQGLPFAEAIENLVDTIAQQLFNSPFNTRRAMRNVIKSASEAIVGYDMSELVLRGMINDVLGMSASSRIGAGDFVPGTRLGTADAEQGRVLEQLLGAPYAMVKDAATNAGKFVGGVFTGDWKETADALRAGGPIALRNVVKGSEQLADGYASDAKGRKITDISTPAALWQLAGVSSAALATMYEQESINIQTKAFHTQVSADMQNQLVQAVRSGDTAKVQEINEFRAAWNREYPGMPIMPNAAATRRAIMLAGVPLDQRSRLLWSRRMRGENVFSEGSEAGQ